jgi:hypothetical protein
MNSLVSELIEVLPDERRPALRYWQEQLQSTIDRTFGDQEDRVNASAVDRQGLGSSQRKAESN